MISCVDEAFYKLYLIVISQITEKKNLQNKKLKINQDFFESYFLIIFSVFGLRFC